MAGAYDLVIACGVESMTRAPMASNARGGTGPFSPAFLAACDNQLKMQFEVAQKIANDWGITRAEMDAFAIESHRRASAAQKAGAFKREIVPINLRDEEGKDTGVVMTDDEGIRHETSAEKMAALPSAHFEPEDRARHHGRQLLADERRRRGDADRSRGDGREARPAPARGRSATSRSAPTPRRGC